MSNDFLALLCPFANKNNYYFINREGRASAGGGLNTIYWREGGGDKTATIVHETGHSFAGFEDEYRENAEGRNYYDFHSTPPPLQDNVYTTGVNQDIGINYCNANAHWKNLKGNGCGQNGVVDCLDKLVFSPYIRAELPNNEHYLKSAYPRPTATCDVQDGSCSIRLATKTCNPFENNCVEIIPCENFDGYPSTVESGCRLFYYPAQIVCSQDPNGLCQYETFCFEGARYGDFDVFRASYSSIMNSSPSPYLFNTISVNLLRNKLATFSGQKVSKTALPSDSVLRLRLHYANGKITVEEISKSKGTYVQENFPSGNVTAYVLEIISAQGSVLFSMPVSFSLQVYDSDVELLQEKDVEVTVPYYPGSKEIRVYKSNPVTKSRGALESTEDISRWQ